MFLYLYHLHLSPKVPLRMNIISENHQELKCHQMQFPALYKIQAWKLKNHKIFLHLSI